MIDYIIGAAHGTPFCEFPHGAVGRGSDIGHQSIRGVDTNLTE